MLNLREDRNQTVEKTEDDSYFGFGPRLRALALGAAAVAFTTGLSGCSPQEKSYWTGGFTNLPKPPATARMQLGVSTEDDGKVFINYVMWDEKEELFVRKDIHYTTTTLKPGTFSEAGGYKQILDGEVLASGAVVDQEKGVILLPGGYVLEGKTGNTLDSAGKIVKEFDK